MAAEGGIFPFGIFTHHVKIDIAGLFTRQRAGDAGEQAHRTQVDVLVELAAELQQRAPQEMWSGTISGQPTAPK
jgi:hypothetical protein